MPIRKRGRAWEVSVNIDGRRVRKSAGRGATKEDAENLQEKIRRDLIDIRDGKQPKRLLSKAILRWLDGDCQELKSVKKYESHTLQILPYIKGRYLNDAPAVANEIKESMPTSPATINRRIAILKRVCNLAYQQWGWLDDPVANKITLLPERNERHLYLTRNQVEQLADACPNPAAGDMCRLAAYTGLRRGELFSLSKDNYQNGCIILDGGTKTGRPRVVPIPDEIQDIAKRIPLKISDAMLRKNFEAAREKINKPDLRFHDLRHTYASWLVQAGAQSTVVRDLLGHTTLAMTSRYAHLEKSHLEAVIRRTFN